MLVGRGARDGRGVPAARLVEEEGRSYVFKLEMLDGQSGAVLAQRENRCEICTDAEALEIAERGGVRAEGAGAEETVRAGGAARRAPGRRGRG